METVNISFQTHICHLYASAGSYEVHIPNPHDIAYVSIPSQQLTDFR